MDYLVVENKVHYKNNSPVKPGRQMHLYPPIRSAHDALWRHGEEWHSFIFASQVVPMNIESGKGERSYSMAHLGKDQLNWI